MPANARLVQGRGNISPALLVPSDAPTSHEEKPQIKPYVLQTEGLVDTGSWIDIVNFVIEHIFETQRMKRQ